MGRASCPSFVASLIIVVVTLTVTACREERIAIVPTSIRESAATDSAKLTDVALGDVVRVRRAGGDPVGVLRADNGYVNEKDVAKRPLAFETRWVTDHGAALWIDPARTQRKRELTVGEQLVVLTNDPLDDVDVVLAADADVAARVSVGERVVGDTGLRPVGFVSHDAIMTTAPTRASLWSRVEARLREQDLEATKRALEAMLVVAPGDEVAREMLVVLLAGTDWQRSRALAAGLATPLPHIDAGLTRADAPGPAYVLASVLRVRHEPSDQGTAVRHLPIGTAVVIEELRADGWARIHIRDDRSQSCMAASPHDVVEVPTDVNAGFASGYALARYLTPTAPTLDVVETRRKDAEGRGMFDEATLWAQRANELAPSRERRAALIDAALAAMRWTVAASALLPSGVDRPNATAEIDLKFVWGCRGDPRRAVLVDARPKEDGAPPSLTDVEGADACTTLNVTRPCPLCWAQEGELTPEQKVADAADAAAEQKLVDARVAAFDRLMRDAKERFGAGPFLRVRSRPSTWPRADDVQLTPWLAIVRFDASVVAANDDELVSVTAIPTPPTTSSTGNEGVVDVWMAVPADESLRFAVVFATSEADAKSKLTPIADERAPNQAHVAASWSRAADGCDCGC